MKFSLSWLKQHLDTEASLQEITDKLTMLGLEVEEVIDRGAELADFTVGYVIEATPHPNADTLRVLRVDTGHGEVQVVCGAPNARTGMKGVFAGSDLTIPGTGLKLKKTKIRDVESNGMLCSEREMGLGDDHDGIIDLPEDAPVGEPFAPLMGLDDPVIDIAITPDRGDCLGVYGIARDLAAAGLGTLKALDATAVAGAFDSPINVHLDTEAETPGACPYFIGRYIRGVTNGPSPKWLQDRLLSIGLRPISALVDITNWMTMDLGRPAHVFDAAKVAGDIRVRMARSGEAMLALDGRGYELNGHLHYRRQRRHRLRWCHGRRGYRLHGRDHGRVSRNCPVRPGTHRRYGPRPGHRERRPLSLRARCRYRLHAPWRRDRHWADP